MQTRHQTQHKQNILQMALTLSFLDFVCQRVLDLRTLDFLVIDEADQLLLPRADHRSKRMKPEARFKAMEYFGGLKELTE